MDSYEDLVVLNIMKYMGLNLVTLLLLTLHVLHQGVSYDLKTREQCALNIVSEFRVNNK